MKQILALALILSMFSLSIVGCSEKPSDTKEEKVTTPADTTTTTVEKEVEKTGDNSPAEQP